MSNSKIKMVTAPIMNVNGFALLFTAQNNTNLQLPMARRFGQALSLSIAFMLEGRNTSNASFPILQLTASKGDVSLIVSIKQAQLTVTFNGIRQPIILSTRAPCVTDKWLNIAVTLSESGFNLFIDGQLASGAKTALTALTALTKSSLTVLSTLDQGQLGWPLLTNKQTNKEINTQQDPETAQIITAPVSFQVKFLRLWRADIYSQPQANADQCANNISETSPLAAYWRYQPLQYSSPAVSLTQRDFGTSSALPQWILHSENKTLEHCPLPLADVENTVSSYRPVYHLTAPQDPARQKNRKPPVIPVPAEDVNTDNTTVTADKNSVSRKINQPASSAAAKGEVEDVTANTVSKDNVSHKATSSIVGNHEKSSAEKNEIEDVTCTAKRKKKRRRIRIRIRIRKRSRS